MIGVFWQWEIHYFFGELIKSGSANPRMPSFFIHINSSMASDAQTGATVPFLKPYVRAIFPEI